MTELGQLSIEFQGDFTRLQRDIERVKSDALRYAKDLEKILTLSVGIDTRSLQSEATKAGKSAAIAFNSAFSDGIKTIKLPSGIKVDSTSYKQAGRAAAQGLVVGIESGSTEVKQAASKMAGLIVDETKSKLRIKSPSGVFKDIGADIVKGLEAGLGSFTSASLFAGLNNIIDQGIQGVKSLVSGGFNFAGDSITKYADLKSITNQLKLVEGSADSLSYVRSEANRLSISIDAAQKSFVSLAASARGTSLAGKETKELFSAVSEAARVYGLSNEQYEGSVLALSQIISKGTVSSEELRGQLAERLPGAFQIAARSIGVTTAQLQKLLETGQLTAEVFLPRFAQQLRTELAGGIAGAGETSAASISKLQNKISGLQESLGKAIEPAVLAGLSFASETLNSFADSNAFDDLNKSAKDFRDFLAQNPQLARDLGKELAGLAKDAMAALGSQAKSLLGYLKEHPTAIRDSVKAMGDFAASIGRALDYALKLVKPLADAAAFISSTEGKLQQAQKTAGNAGGGLKDVNDTNPILAGIIKFSQSLGLNKDIGDRTGQAARSGFVNSPLQVVNDPHKAHHGGNAYSSREFDGSTQTFRAGTGLLTKDLVLALNGRQTGAPIPAPVGGIARNRTDNPGGYGNYTDVEDKTGKLLARVAHLSKFADIKDGQAVQAGQIIGYQGNTGRSTGTHLHIEMPKELWAGYLQALKTGNYSNLPNTVGIVATPQQRAAVQSNAGVARVAQDSGWMRTVASTYGSGDGFDGKPTASGEKFNQNELTAAINENLKKNLGVRWGDKIEAINPTNGKSVVVRITDHGPYEKQNGRYVPHSTRGLDLSTAAAKQIGISLGEVQFRVLGKGQTAIASSPTAASTTSGNLNGSTKPQDTPASIAALLKGIDLERAQARTQTLRDSQGQVLATRDRVINSEYSAIKNPTIDQKNQNEINSIILNYDSQIREIANRLQDTKSRLAINENKLKGGGLTSEVTDSINNQLAADKKALTEYTALAARVSKARATALTEASSQQSSDTQYRAEQQRFTLNESELRQLQEKISYFKQLNQDNPDDNITLRLPDLQKEYDTKSASLELDKKIVDIRQQVIKGELTPGEAQARITGLDEYNQLQEHRIDLEYKAAKSAATLQTAQRNLGQSIKESSDYLQTLQRDLQKSQLGLGGNSADIQKQISGLSSQNNYDQGVASIMSDRTLDPRERERRQQQLDQQLADENQISAAQQKKDARQRQLSGAGAVLGSYQDLFAEQGGKDKGVSRTLGRAQIALDYQKSLASMESLRDAGELTAEQFDQVTKNLEAMNNVKLSNLEGQFDVLKQPLADLQDFGQNALADLISGSKSLSDVLSDLAGNLATTLAKAAASSIFGDLFGGNKKGGGLLGGGDSGGGLGGILGMVGGLFGFADGGIVGGLQAETAKTGRKSHLIIASEGERVLNLRETAIWNRLNRPMAFAEGGMIGANMAASSGNSINLSIPITVGSDARGNGFDQSKQAALKQAIVATVLSERRPGGSLYNV